MLGTGEGGGGAAGIICSGLVCSRTIVGTGAGVAGCTTEGRLLRGSAWGGGGGGVGNSIL